MSTIVNLDALLAGTNFQPPAPLKPRLVMEVDGMDGTGKTRFALTAPKPILYQSIDFGTEGVIQQFDTAQVRVAHYFRPPLPASKDADQVKALFLPVVQAIERDFRKALTMPRGTLVVDTESELWEMAQLAFHGKVVSVPTLQRAASNGWWLELVRAAVDSNVNLILLRQMRDEWEDYQEDGKRKSRKTGRKLPIGNEKTQFLVQARMEMRRRLGKPAVVQQGYVLEPEVKAGWEMEFTKVRHNGDLVGMVLTDNDINFEMVASLMAPSVPAEAWV